VTDRQAGLRCFRTEAQYYFTTEQVRVAVMVQTRISVRILAGTQPSLEAFRGVPQFLHPNAGIAPP
jgi:hypothetical protein